MTTRKAVYSATTDLDLRAMELTFESGFMGRIFGTGRNAPHNIAGAIAFLLILAGLIMLLAAKDAVTSIEFWRSSVVPIVSTIAGFLFGRSHNK